MKKELLIKLRDRIKDEEELESGLCLEIRHMYSSTNISYAEEHELLSFIEENRPKRGKHFVHPLQFDDITDSRWYWNKGEVAPRLAWLNDKIKHFKNEK